MNKPILGIRQADGSFYAIMEDEGTPRKRLVLSAARADQHSVRIDLYRSTDGLMEDATLVGSLDLMSDDSLEFQDIGFEISIDEAAQLSATATLPNGESSSVDLDLSEFRNEKRSDSDILEDHAFDDAELDTLDDAFGPDDGDTLSMDLPEAELDSLEMDDSFALDDPLADLSDAGLDTALGAEPTFSMDDLDAGFGTEEPAEEALPAPPAASDDDESWHDFSMDDMEPMEFLDTGDEISAPKSGKQPKAASKSEFSMDDEAPLDLSMDDELGDLGSFGDFDDKGEMSDSLPAFGAPASGGLDEAGFDEDFLPPPELSDADYVPPPAKDKKAAKAKPEPKKAKPAAKAVKAPSGSQALDKTALVLSLITLSLLVVSLVVLLVLNMMRPPQIPVIQPEVMAWPQGAQTAASGAGTDKTVTSLDLGAPDAVSLSAGTVLEIPAGLQGIPVTLRLPAGDTVAEATRRFGAPERVEGDLLSW